MSDLPNLQSLFTARTFRIPEYQRGYSWTSAQWQDLLDDLEELRDDKEHFTGTVVLQPTETPPIVDAAGEEHQVFDVVDGQQRLTTLLLLLDSVRREAATVDGALAPLAAGIASRYLRLTDPAGQSQSKLRFSDGSQQYFEHHVLADVPSPDGPATPAQRRLSAASNFFRAFLADRRSELGDAFPEWLGRFHSKVAHRLKLNLYEVEDAAEVGVIFEVMNNRGRPLSDLDLVKNYVLYVGTKLAVPAHDLHTDVAHTWNRVFTNLMSADLGETEHENQLLRSHWLMGYDYDRRNWAGSKSVKARLSLREYPGEHEQLLTDLRTFVRTLADASVAYCDAHRPTRAQAFSAFSHDVAQRQEIIRLSDCLVRMNVLAAFRPLLVATRLKHPTDPSKYLAVVRMCELFAFRVYRLLRLRSHAGQSTLFKLAYSLYNDELTFEEMLSEFAGTLLYYCPDSSFQQAFALRDDVNDWYTWVGIKYFLYEYERAVSGNDDMAITWAAVEKADRQKTVEHILPQTPEDEYWLTRFDDAAQERLTSDIGNLCLTHDNSSYGNKAFPLKRGAPGQEAPCYANAALRSERELAAYQDWGPEEILHRRARIVDWALQRWGLPEQLQHPGNASLEPEEDVDDD